MRLMRIKNDLEWLSMSDYKECIDQICYFCTTKIQNIISVYQFGSIQFPGISDIDILIIIYSLEHYDNVFKKITKFIRSTDKLKYCLWHNPIIISEQEKNRIYRHRTMDNIKLLMGKDVDFLENKRHSDSTTILWNFYFYQLLLRARKSRSRLSARYLLLLANNLAYSIRCNNALLGLDDLSFTELVTNLRKEFIGKKHIDTCKINLLYEQAHKIINRQEKWINQSSQQIRIVPDFIGRKIYLQASTLKYFNMGVFKIFYYPNRYFVARDTLKLKVQEEFPSSYRAYLAECRRFQCPKLMDI